MDGYYVVMGVGYLLIFCSSNTSLRQSEINTRVINKFDDLVVDELGKAEEEAKKLENLST